MNNLTKEQIETYDKDYWESCEFHTLVDNLYTHSRNLHDEISFTPEREIPLLEHRLSEIFTLFNVAKLYATIKELGHYQFSSLFSFWESFYQQLYLVITEDAPNKTREQAEFKNYANQYEIVDQMLSMHIKGLQKTLKYGPYANKDVN